MSTPYYGMLSMCYLKHCYLCGVHHGSGLVYCLSCMDGRFSEVEKDAKIRAITGDREDHRFWMLDHPEEGSWT